MPFGIQKAMSADMKGRSLNILLVDVDKQEKIFVHFMKKKYTDKSRGNRVEIVIGRGSNMQAQELSQPSLLHCKLAIIQPCA